MEEGVPWACKETRRSIVPCASFGEMQIALVHTFEIPSHFSLCPIDLKYHLARSAASHTPGLQSRHGTVTELGQGTNVILIGHWFAWAARINGKMCAFRRRHGAMRDECV